MEKVAIVILTALMTVLVLFLVPYWTYEAFQHLTDHDGNFGFLDWLSALWFVFLLGAVSQTNN